MRRGRYVLVNTQTGGLTLAATGGRLFPKSDAISALLWLVRYDVMPLATQRLLMLTDCVVDRAVWTDFKHAVRLCAWLNAVLQAHL